MQSAAKAYLRTQVSTTTQGSLLLMLYDGAIKFLRQAKDRMAEKDYAAKGILISKAMDIIAELDGSLNAQKGGDVAENLHKLYFYCNARLLKANLEMNPKFIDEVISILDGLRSAFQEVVDRGEGSAATAPMSERETRTAPPVGLGSHTLGNFGGSPLSAPRANPTLAAKAPAAYAAAASHQSAAGTQEQAVPQKPAAPAAPTAGTAPATAPAAPGIPQAKQPAPPADTPQEKPSGLLPGSPLLQGRRLAGASSVYRKMSSNSDS